MNKLQNPCPSCRKTKTCTGQCFKKRKQQEEITHMEREHKMLDMILRRKRGFTGW